MYTSPQQPDSWDKYDEPRLHLERFMRIPLVNFNLPLKILIILEGARIRTVGDLVKQSPDSLLKIKYIGHHTVRLLQDFLNYYYLDFQKNKAAVKQPQVSNIIRKHQ